MLQGRFRKFIVVAGICVLLAIVSLFTLDYIASYNAIHIKGGITKTSLSPNGDLLAIASRSYGTQIWDTNEQKHLFTLGDPAVAHAMAWSPDGHLLARSKWGGIEIFRIADGVRIALLASDTNVMTNLTWSYDGLYLASTTDWKTQTASIWRVDEQHAELVQTLPVPALYVAFSPSEDLLVLSSDTGVFFWNIEQAEIVAELPDDIGRGVQAFSPDGRFLALARREPLGTDIDIVQLDNYSVIQRISGYEDLITKLAFSPDGSFIAVAGGIIESVSTPAPVQVWRIADGQLIANFEGHRSGILGLDFLPDGKTIISGSGDTTIRFWILESP
jgi:WD40 repeat protein